MSTYACVTAHAADTCRRSKSKRSGPQSAVSESLSSSRHRCVADLNVEKRLYHVKFARMEWPGVQ